MTKKRDMGKAALEYHSAGRPGKIEVTTTKSCQTEWDLSLAYSPGVAEPCNHIFKNPDDVYKYTTKGNLVAVVSNGTAVLGLGNLGAAASKPVMEGKGNLFKRFADIDVFDIELNTTDPDEIIKTVQLLEPTFGGVNLEDIKAPECFYIERTLKETTDIPIFHDDQHGTAIISAAALLNALDIVNKSIEKVKIVFSGGGASAIACARLYKDLGVRRENLLMCDSRGVIYEGREKLNEFKLEFAINTSARTLADAMKDADVFVGLSVKGAVTKEMVTSMAKDPIVFAMANPDPEITPEDALSVRDDVIMATGRSDYPNQVNNVLGFPFIFRGALDVRSRAVNEEMKHAAVKALAKLARQEVPDYVCRAYGVKRLRFGREYIIPKPFDSRVLLWVAPAVAKAAMDSGVARIKIDLDEYVVQLEKRLGVRQSFIRSIKDSIRRSEGGKKEHIKIVFPEGANDRVLRACDQLVRDEIAVPILLGDKKHIEETVKDLGLENLGETEIINPNEDLQKEQTRAHVLVEQFANALWKLRQRKGLSLERAFSLIKNENYFGAMMVKEGLAHSLLSGATQNYPATIRPLLETIGSKPATKIAGVYMMLFKQQVYFFADTTVNIDPSAEDLADIAILTADEARFFDIEPRVAMLSFSNFGSNPHPHAHKVQDAVRFIKSLRPDIQVDGEMQADTAVVPEIAESVFPFCELGGKANVLIFPDLQSSNICYKLMQRIGGAEAIGPILVGMNKPINILQRSADVDEIVNMARITVLECRKTNGSLKKEKLSQKVGGYLTGAR